MLPFFSPHKVQAGRCAHRLPDDPASISLSPSSFLHLLILFTSYNVKSFWRFFFILVDQLFFAIPMGLQKQGLCPSGFPPNNVGLLIALTFFPLPSSPIFQCPIPSLTFLMESRNFCFFSSFSIGICFNRFFFPPCREGAQ